MNGGRTVVAAGVVALLVGATAGCSAPSSRIDAVESAALAFRSAVAEGDSETACELLTPATADELGRGGTPCAAALAEVNLADPGPIEGVDVWGRSALARFGGGEVFLIRVDDAWRVRAAGCELRAGRPAECEVGG
jgi:hypothetical protein